MNGVTVFKTYVLLVLYCLVCLIGCFSALRMLLGAIGNPRMDSTSEFLVCIIALILGIIASALLELCAGALYGHIKSDLKNRRIVQLSNELLRQAGMDPALPEFISVPPVEPPETGE